MVLAVSPELNQGIESFRQRLPLFSSPVKILLFPAIIGAILFWTLLPCLILLLHTQLAQSRERGESALGAWRDTMSSFVGLLMLSIVWILGTLVLAFFGDWLVIGYAIAFVVFLLSRR